MNRFEYTKANTVDAATKLMNSTVPEAMTTQKEAAIVKAAGTDLLDLMKEGLLRPKRVIDLKGIPGLDQISYSKEDGLRIGAMATIADLADSEVVAMHYPALQQAAAHAATPQIRNMATMGGNLMQRPRCWYFRSADHHCLKKGGEICFAQEGQNQFHGIFDTEICPCVHPSSIATALVAYDGSVLLASGKEERTVTFTEFFTPAAVNVTCENVAHSQEVIQQIILPTPATGTRAHYIKGGQRESYDWSMGDVAVVLRMNGEQVTEARIVLGAASSVPLRRPKAEAVLQGKRLNEKRIAKAVDAALDGARPLAHNGYKLPLFRTIIQRAITKAVG